MCGLWLGGVEVGGASAQTPDWTSTTEQSECEGEIFWKIGNGRGAAVETLGRARPVGSGSLHPLARRQVTAGLRSSRPGAG